MTYQSTNNPGSTLPAVRIDRCYAEHVCAYPHCGGRGTQFATDLAHGRLLGYFCDNHTIEEIEALWPELKTIIAHLIVTTPGRVDERLEMFFRGLGATLVDVTPTGDEEEADDEDDLDDEDEDDEDLAEWVQ